MAGETRMKPDATRPLRPVTALVCDLVDSTSLVRSAGVRSAGEIVRAVVEALTRVALDSGGTIEAFSGDGVAVVFGAERVRLSDAEDAAACALRMLKRIGELEVLRGIESLSAERLAIRIGINSDLVTTGPILGSLAKLTWGDALTLAAKLQVRARPNQILIGRRTAEMLPDRFLRAEVQVQLPDGNSKVWQLMGEAYEERAHRPFFGRTCEIDRLVGWVEDRTPASPVILMLGEAGMGKTALVEQVREHLTGHHWAAAAYVSPAGLSGWKVLGSIVAEVLRGLNIPVLEGVDELAERLDQLIEDRHAARTLSKLVHSLSISDQPEGLNAATAPSVERGLARLLKFAASVSAIVIQVPDADVLDSSTVRVLLDAVNHASTDVQLRVFVELRRITDDLRRIWSGWTRRPVFFELNELSSEDSERLVSWHDPSGALSGAERNRILEAAKGNPLLLELLSHRKGHSYLLRPEVRPPARLEVFVRSVADDFSPDESAVAELLAIAGSMELERVEHFQAPNQDFSAGLTSLIDRQVLMVDAPTRTLWYRHNTFREAILFGLDPQKRKKVHQALVSSMESRPPADLRRGLSLLAFHASEADDHQKALDYCQLLAYEADRDDDLMACISALRRAVRHSEAIGGYEAMAASLSSLIPKLVAAGESASALCEIERYRGLPDEVQIWRDGWSFEAEALINLGRLKEVDDLLGVGLARIELDTSENSRAQLLRSEVYLMRGDLNALKGQLDAVRQSSRGSDYLFDARLSRLEAGLLLKIGKLEEARDSLRSASAALVAMGEGHKELSLRVQIDWAVLELMNENLHTSRAALIDVLKRAENAGLVGTVAHAGTNLVYCLWLSRQFQLGADLAEWLAQYLVSDYWKSGILLNSAFVDLSLGDPRSAAGKLSSALMLLADEVEDNEGRVAILATLARCDRLIGNKQKALTRIADLSERPLDADNDLRFMVLIEKSMCYAELEYFFEARATLDRAKQVKRVHPAFRARWCEFAITAESNFGPPFSRDPHWAELLMELDSVTREPGWVAVDQTKGGFDNVAIVEQADPNLETQLRQLIDRPKKIGLQWQRS